MFSFFWKLYLFKLLSKSMNWIPLIQQKPQDRNEVLIYDDNQGIHVSYYLKVSNSFISSVDGARFTHVSFWMPVPEVPPDID